MRCALPPFRKRSSLALVAADSSAVACWLARPSCTDPRGSLRERKRERERERDAHMRGKNAVSESITRAVSCSGFAQYIHTEFATSGRAAKASASDLVDALLIVRHLIVRCGWRFLPRHRGCGMGCESGSHSLATSDRNSSVRNACVTSRSSGWVFSQAHAGRGRSRQRSEFP